MEGRGLGSGWTCGPPRPGCLLVLTTRGSTSSCRLVQWPQGGRRSSHGAEGQSSSPRSCDWLSQGTRFFPAQTFAPCGRHTCPSVPGHVPDTDGFQGRQSRSFLRMVVKPGKGPGRPRTALGQPSPAFTHCTARKHLSLQSSTPYPLSKSTVSILKGRGQKGARVRPQPSAKSSWGGQVPLSDG